MSVVEPTAYRRLWLVVVEVLDPSIHRVMMDLVIGRKAVISWRTRMGTDPRGRGTRTMVRSPGTVACCCTRHMLGVLPGLFVPTRPELGFSIYEGRGGRGIRTCGPG